jgi:phosphoribosyl-ATP pyrophosphohydrolase
MNKFDQLEKLAEAISANACLPAERSYTAQLLANGTEKCAKKFGEEAVELALAAVQGKKKEAAYEAADVLYHFLVLLKSTGISPEDVMQELEKRAGTSGLAEKASRKNA